MSVVILGYRTFVSKKGIQWTVYYVVREFNRMEIQQGRCEGSVVESYWCDEFFPVVVGQPYELQFAPSADGRARLVGLREIKKEG